MKNIAVLLLLFVACNIYSQVKDSNEPKVVVTFAGSYNPNFSSMGKILNWNLYDDGSMSGYWNTNNGSVSLNILGTYKIQKDYLIFKAEGQILLPNKEVTKTTILGYGLFQNGKASGEYILQIENKNYNNDFGTWNVELQ